MLDSNIWFSRFLLAVQRSCRAGLGSASLAMGLGLATGPALGLALGLASGLATGLAPDVARAQTQGDNSDGALLPGELRDVFTVYRTRSKMLYEGEDTRHQVLVSLNTEGRHWPSVPVTVEAFVSDPSEAQLQKSGEAQSERVQLQFTKWGEAASFEIVSQDDALVDGDQEVMLHFAPTVSDDPRFHGVQLEPITFVNADNEVDAESYVDPYLEVKVDRQGLAEDDRRLINVTVRLKQCPSDWGAFLWPTVVDFTEARFVGGPSFIYWSPENWQREVKFQIEAVNDTEVDGDTPVGLHFFGSISGWSGQAGQCGAKAGARLHYPKGWEFTIYDNEKPGDKPPRATILKHGWDHPGVRNIVRGIEDIKNSPYDGIFFSGGAALRVFSDQLVDVGAMREALAPLTRLDFGSTRKNYLMVEIASIEGGFNGQGTQNLIENFRRLGQVIKELELAGSVIEGIAFDNEVYFRGNPWDMPQACPGLERPACTQAAFEAGQAMLGALIENWPKVRFMPFYGFWLHDPATYRQLSKYAPYPNSTQSIDMFGYFAAGTFAATVGKEAQYIDGGELYTLRTASQYERTREWLLGDMADQSPFLPDDLRSAYKAQAKTGFGLYDDRTRHWGRATEAVPVVWESIIDAAKREADVIWLYTERHDWWPNDGRNWPTAAAQSGIARTEGYVTKDWREAARRGILAR